MAIIIPSKHIYEIKNNKIIENRINKVEVNATQVKPFNEFDTVVYSENVDINQNSIVESEETPRLAIDTQLGANAYHYAYVYFRNEVKYLKHTITLPKVSNNKRVTTLKKVEVSVFGNVTTAKTTGQMLVSSNLNFTLGSINQTARNEKEKTFDWELPETFTSTYNGIPRANASVTGYSDESSYSFTETDNTYEIELTTLVSYTKETLLGNGQVKPVDGYNTSVAGEGEYAYYEPIQLRISVYGNTTGIELDETNLVFGQGEKTDFSVSNNELLQTSNYRKFVDIPNSIEYNIGNTMTEYSRGKECATILCSISDYYNEQGLKAIDITDEQSMLFKEFDEVTPYIYNARGKDEPMSVNKENVPKTFVVVGVEPFYDGAVWQRLYLVER